MKSQRDKIIDRVKNAAHQRKPDAENTTVFYDLEGHVLFEMYMPTEKHRELSKND